MRYSHLQSSPGTIHELLSKICELILSGAVSLHPADFVRSPSMTVPEFVIHHRTALQTRIIRSRSELGLIDDGTWKFFLDNGYSPSHTIRESGSERWRQKVVVGLSYWSETASFPRRICSHCVGSNQVSSAIRERKLFSPSRA